MHVYVRTIDPAIPSLNLSPVHSLVHMHVKPLVDTIPKNAVTTIMWQAVLISLYACSTFSFLFSHLILIITTVSRRIAKIVRVSTSTSLTLAPRPSPLTPGARVHFCAD